MGDRCYYTTPPFPSHMHTHTHTPTYTKHAPRCPTDVLLQEKRNLECPSRSANLLITVSF